MKVFIYIFILVIVFSTFSCSVWSEPDYIQINDNPLVCFNEITEKCGNELYKIPMPSSYMYSALPDGLVLNIDPKTPFTVKFSASVDLSTANSKNIMILENNVLLTPDLYSIDYKTDSDGNKDKTILSISNTSGSWNPDATYIVIMLNGIKAKSGLIFGKSKAWFLAVSEFPLLTSDGKSAINGLDDDSAKALQGLRDALAPKLDLLTSLFGISRFDITLLWSFKFRTPVACFKETLKGCENDPIPIPSDYMLAAVPVNTNLNISKKENFSLKFSDKLDPSTVKDNIIILKQKGSDLSLLTSSDFNISYKLSPETNITDTSRIYIEPTSNSWDSGSKYLIVIKKGILNHLGETIESPAAAFFTKMETSLFTDSSLTKLVPKMGLIFKDDLETPKALEMLRLLYKPSLDALKSMINLERKDIVMFWSVTLDDDYIIPCFKSNNFYGCENATEAPLPSDFIMAYKFDEAGKEISHHLNLPVTDDDPMKPLIDGINTLDGWSTSREFSLILSDKLDTNTIKTDLSKIPTEMPNLWVLKLTKDNNGNIIGATPTMITTDFIDNWNTLNIRPLMKTWEENTTYLIILTDSIKGKNNQKLVKPIVFSFMSEKEPLLNEDGSPKYLALKDYDKETLNSLEGAREKFDMAFKMLKKPMSEGGLGIDRKNISMMWTVTTQTVTQDMKNIILGIKSNPNLFKLLTLTDIIDNNNIESFFSDDINSYWMQGGEVKFDNVSKIVIGNFVAPWMLTEQNVFDKNKLLGNITQEDFKPIPVLISFPLETNDIQDNNKVIIFQHGINDSKEEVLPILNTLNGAGYIVVSMDLPLHGARSLDTTDLYDNFSYLRKQPDGVPDKSGEGFLGLNIFGTRDLIRQAVIEQSILVETLKLTNFNSLDSSIKFSTIDSNNIKYLGFSLGTIIGNIFISVDDSIKSAILNSGGGILTKIIMNTKPSISNSLFTALESMGLQKGTKQLNDFLYLAQTVLDPADPINYKRDSLPVLLQESIGDPVMPNSSTSDLAVILGLINPINGEFSPNYKLYQMDDNDPNKMFWHSFMMIPKSPAVCTQARADLINFLATH